MPTLNIKDYLLAALLFVILCMSVVIVYDKARITSLASKVEAAEILAKAQEKANKQLEDSAIKIKEELDEKHKIDTDHLNAVIVSLRNSNKSTLSRLPKSSGGVDEITFQRSAFDREISEYRQQISELFGVASSCEIDLREAQDWTQRIYKLYQKED